MSVDQTPFQILHHLHNKYALKGRFLVNNTI